MIFVDRSDVGNPLAPSTRLGRSAVEEIERIGSQLSKKEFRQKRIQFKAYRHPEVKAALSNLFHGKCAYCETVASPGFDLDIEQYRPKSGVMESPSHPGYWWLANAWENLLLACQMCNRRRFLRGSSGGEAVQSGKGNRFPLVDEDERVFEPNGDLSGERPLLIDPTIDDPLSHLVFDERGMVNSETQRGNTTIAVLGLNRRALVEARRAARERLISLANILANSNDDKEVTTLIADMVRPEAAYAGMLRQTLQQLGLPELLPETFAPQRPVSRRRIERARAETQRYAKQMSDYSLDSEEGLQRFKSQKRFVEQIRIKNIRAIKDLELEFKDQAQRSTSWLMLLGENGTGKSTVLQAVALLLSGQSQVEKLLETGRIDPASMVRYRCKSGRISIKLSGFPKPHELVVHSDRFEFHGPHGERRTSRIGGNSEGDGWESQTIVLGYGATRLLPKGEAHKDGMKHSRIANLFDPHVSLINAKAWLANLDRQTFDTTAIILKDLLSLHENAELVRQRGDVWIKAPGSKTALKDLSDGYRSVVAMTVDILDVLSSIWPNLIEAEGVVLVDELDAHLHPTWQMKIVGSLRTALPGLQFITSTHQPLCLRGLKEGEIVVMRKDEEGLVAPLTDLPSPEDFRVDQLLTSDFFGLSSTIDPETEELFDSYYALLAMENRTSEEENSLKRLQAELEGRERLGHTYRETLFYEAIDELLAKQRLRSRIAPEQVREESKVRISELWEEAFDKSDD